MKHVISLLVFIAVAFSSWSAFKLYDISKLENEIKYDYAEVNKIKYGLFNLGIWKEQIFSILQSKAGSFELKASDFRSVKKELEKYLYDLHEEYFVSGKLVESLMNESKNSKNSVGKMLMGLFKGSIEKQIDQIDFKSKIPGIADQLMIELKKKTPELQRAITNQISKMITEEAGEKLADQRQPILDKYETENFENLNNLLTVKVNDISVLKKKWITWSLGGLFAALLILLLGKSVCSFSQSILWMTIICTVFLAIGLALPMIDLDARLSTVDLKIMDSNVHFNEQVMYFQSKSILDVTQTLLQGRGVDLKLVGLLILLFSIILPFMKMLLTCFFVLKASFRESVIVKTVIFYLGKWSMADVFVVAIFMSYIGFYGLINSQLGDLSGQSNSYTLETVNYSKLSPGIIYFTLYCVFSIVMSSIIHRKYRSTLKARQVQIQK